MTTKLNSVNGANIFCGPAAISTIAGISTDEAARLVQEARYSRQDVRAMYLSEVMSVLNKLGWRTNQIRVPAGTSLFFFLSTMKEDGYYLLLLPSHFVVIEKLGSQRVFCDNHTKQPMNAASSARNMQEVRAAIKVDKI